jgi:SSS family solute:Na+ symporter
MAHPFDPFSSKGLGWVLWQAMTALAVMTTWQTTISRVLAAKDADTAKRVYRGTWFYFAGRWALPGLWGLGAFLYFTSHGGLPAGIDSQTALPKFLAILLKPGLLGIVLAAMLAAEMSTDSGYLLTWATVIYNDLITPCLSRPMSERARLLTVRMIVLAIGLFLVFYGLWYEMPGNVWAYLAITGNIYLASMFALLVGALYWRGSNTWGAFSAIVLGTAGPLCYLVVNYIAGKELISDWVSGLAAFGLAFVGMVAGSWVGRALGRAGAPAPVAVEEVAP